MEIYFSSDQHYFHKNIIKYCNRPFSSIEEMNEQLIENHNSIVKKKDTIYYLGDFGFSSVSNLKSIISRLNGSKYLILGNHDSSIQKSMKDFIGSNLFVDISIYKEINIDKQHINLFHYPMATWNKRFHKSWHFHGHCHGNFTPDAFRIDVGVDCLFDGRKYFPISFEQIKNFFNQSYLKDSPSDLTSSLPSGGAEDL